MLPSVQTHRHVLDLMAAGLPASLPAPIRDISIIETIRRPYSEILHCLVKMRGGRDRRVVAKLITGPTSDASRLQQLMRRDFCVNQHLHKMFMGSTTLAVPTPMLFSPENNLIVTEFMLGTRLQDKLNAGCRWFPSADKLAELQRDCFNCGEWIREFQGASGALLADTTDFDRDAINGDTLQNEVEVRLVALAKAAPDLFSDVDRREIMTFVARDVALIRTTAQEISGIHGDFFAGNVLVGAGRTVGFDFVLFRAGLKLVDPCYFLFQLGTLGLKPNVGHRVVRRLEQAFLDGYSGQTDLRAFWRSSPTTRVLYVLDRLKRLWGMADPEPLPPLRRLYRHTVAIRTTRQIKSHIRTASS